MHSKRIQDRKIVFVNQAVNYLSIGIVNEFAQKFEHVALVTGSVHVQGESLDKDVQINSIIRFTEAKLWKKFLNWIIASFQIFYLLLIKYRKHEVFFIPNPPIAYLMMLVLPHRFSILKWDVYPDVLKIFGIRETNLIYRFWAYLNRRIFRKAFGVYTIGQKITELIAQYVEEEKITKTPLWTTFTDFTPIPKEENKFIREHKLWNKFIVQYSGNIGVTHNVELLIDVAEALVNEHHIHFQIIGRGNRYKEIKARIDSSKLENCQLLPFQSDDLFPHSLSAANLGVVVLDDKTSKGSVPSKTYNLMTAAKPIIYIASKESELYDYAERYKNGKCFHSSEISKIAEFITQVAADQRQYEQLSDNSLLASKDFTRANAMKLVDHYASIKH